MSDVIINPETREITILAEDKTVNVIAENKTIEIANRLTINQVQQAYWGEIEGNINDQEDLALLLDNKPDLGDISDVGFSGDYGDLLNKPSIPNKTSDLSNDSGFLIAETDPIFSAWDKDYNDLTNTPFIPSQLSDLSDDSSHRLVTDLEKIAWNNKQDLLGFTPENLANKSTTLNNPNNTTYPTTSAISTALALIDQALATINNALSGKQDNLGFTPENIANKENTTIDTSPTKYPTINLLKTGLDAKANLTGATFTGNISATNLSGTNTGDETQSSIQNKLGIASINTSGYLTLTDWNIFNSKQSALGYTPFNVLGDTLTGTAGAGFVGYNSQSVKPTAPTTGFRLYADSTNKFSWIGQNGYIRTFDGTSNTADRSYTLPDKSGTVALTSDITGGIPAGSNTEIQYNNSGAFGASSRFFWNNGLRIVGRSLAQETLLLVERYSSGGTLFSIEKSSQDKSIITLSDGGTVTLFLSENSINLNPNNASAVTFHGGNAKGVNGAFFNICSRTTTFDSGNAAFPLIQLKSASNQSANLLEFRDAANNLLTNFSFNGAFQPVFLSDIKAPNNSLYYSTNQAKLCYKDNGGNVNLLY